MDKNILFIVVFVCFFVYIVQKNLRLVIFIVLICIGYIAFKNKYTNPKEFIIYCSDKIKDFFSGNNNNDNYNSNYNKNKKYVLNNDTSSVYNNNTYIQPLQNDNYYLDKNTIIVACNTNITINDIILKIPVLLDYKLFLEKVIKFTLQLHCISHDSIQQDFIATQFYNKMLYIFHNAYNTIADTKYSIQTYNELRIAENNFNDTLNIFTFLSDMNENDTNKLTILQNNFLELNNKLNQFIIDSVNNISPENYNTTTSILPQLHEPQPLIPDL